MTRVARSFVASDDVADEVVQEAWLAVIRGIDGFERRSSLKTWIFHILVNRARSRGARERRTTPFSALERADEVDGPTVDPDRFFGRDHPFAGYWCVPSNRFFELPDELLLAAEGRGVVQRAVEDLPERQREVIRLRDIDGWDAEEVCDLLGLSAANQRVLLHRARARVRSLLEDYYAEMTPA